MDCVGKSGGLALLWKEEICFEILNFSVYHIHGLVTLILKRKRIDLLSVPLLRCMDTPILLIDLKFGI